MYRAYFDLQLETRRRLGVPPQPLRFFTTVHEKFARAGDFEVWFATFEGHDQAGLVLLRNGDQLCYKWGARIENGHPGANHLLVANMIEAYAGKVRSIDFGRCDMRNQGLVRSKADLGCVLAPAPVRVLPQGAAQHQPGSPERFDEDSLAVWKRLPLPVTRVLGEAFYRYLA